MLLRQPTRSPARRPRAWTLLANVMLALPLASLGLVVALSGCEVVVGDTLPAFACVGSDPSSCPSGQSCVFGVCRAACVGSECLTFGPDASSDAAKDVTVIVIPDAGRETGLVDAPRDVTLDAPHDAGRDVVTLEAAPVDSGEHGALGDICTNNAGCRSNLCVSVADNLAGVTVSGSMSVCSAVCCTDNDCGPGGVCYPTTAGNLCITSGVAATCTNGDCGTSCCTDSDCTSGAFCAVSTHSFGVSVPSCEPFAGGGFDGGFDAGGCTSSDECEHNACIDVNGEGSCQFGCECVPAYDCCDNSPCGNNGACAWYGGNTYGGDGGATYNVFRTCVEQGNTPSGQSCTNAEDCVSGSCVDFPSLGSVCTQPCCTDANCAGIGTAEAEWKCQPVQQKFGDVGNITLFVCAPP